jgi:DUF971 family protein
MTVPTNITAKKSSRLLVVTFADVEYELPFEYLRVFSPSAEVRGHAGIEHGLPKVLVIDKEEVGIKAVEPVGNYAIRIVFDDGHDSGIYSWSTLRELGEKFDEYWNAYQERLKKAGMPRKHS